MLSPRQTNVVVAGKDTRTNNQKMLDHRVIAYDVAKKELYEKAAHDQTLANTNKHAH